MPDVIHLSRAPIVEALIQFQANTAARWDPRRVREQLQPAWPEHTAVQEMRTVEFKLEQRPGQALQQSVHFPDVDAFIFSAPGQQTVYQARRDGLIVSWLRPYGTWEAFRGAAFQAWSRFQEILSPEELHAVTLRYINRLEFPATDFQFERYFTAPPAKPPGGEAWSFQGFHHQSLFAVPGSGCLVQVVFTRVEAPPETMVFLLDNQVLLREPLTATGRTAEDALEEMCRLKDEAFFSMLTPEALDHYV